MLGLGWGEILLVAGVALVVVGPERLPRLLRDLGRMYGQVRRTADELRRSFVLEAERQDAEERYAKLQERRKSQAAERAEALRDGASPEELERRASEREPSDDLDAQEPSKPVPFGGPTTVASGTLSDDGFVGDGPSASEAAEPASAEETASPPESADAAPRRDESSTFDDSGSFDDPEAPHPVQPARSERP